MRNHASVFRRGLGNRGASVARIAIPLAAACRLAIPLACHAGCDMSLVVGSSDPARPAVGAPPPSTAQRRNEGSAASQGWRALEPGLDLGVFEALRASAVGDSRVRVVRVDPARFDLRLLNASASHQGQSWTAKEWAQREGLAATINASMYQTDHRRSVALMRARGHVNNPNLTSHRSVLAFDPIQAGFPRVKMIDRECDDLDTWGARYGTLVQSIRMLSCKGSNAWSQQPRQWSTAAIGIDREGRALLIHVRSPYSVHDLVENLKGLPLGLARAMYVEGGPEAQLYVRGGGEEHEFVGSYETGFNENDDNDHAWRVPNVVGVASRNASGKGAAPRHPDPPLANPPPAATGPAPAEPPAPAVRPAPIASAAPATPAARGGDGRAESVADRVRRDLIRGQDVVVVSYVGLWYQNQHDPSHNLYWGNIYGHSTFPPKQDEIRARLPFLAVTTYSPILERSGLQDPIAVKVFEARVPGATGKLKVVTLAYADMARAVREMATQLKTGAVPHALASDRAVHPLLARSYVIGYWGHNIYWGGFDADDLESLARTTGDLPRGVFFVGCQSARWFPQKFLNGSIEPLLFTTTNMAPEAYIAVALYDGLARGLGRDEIRQSVARAYGVYQKLATPPVSLFINDPAAIKARCQPLAGGRAATPPDRDDTVGLRASLDRDGEDLGRIIRPRGSSNLSGLVIVNAMYSASVGAPPEQPGNPRTRVPPPLPEDDGALFQDERPTPGSLI